jgi:hypothetical protein
VSEDKAKRKANWVFHRIGRVVLACRPPIHVGGRGLGADRWRGCPSIFVCDAQERGLCRITLSVTFGRRAPAASGGKAERRQKCKLKVGVDIPARDEIKAIVEAAKGRWRPILLTAIFTGLRASKLRGLR